MCIAALSGVASFDNVLTYHNSLTRNGDYEIPDLTLAAAANMHPDTGFNGTVSGNVYAQPLFWHPSGGNAEDNVSTESNNVYALDATTGAVAWEAKLAASVPLNQLPCGNIDPDGITGTPVIDPKAGVLYLDALTTRQIRRRSISSMRLSLDRRLRRFRLAARTCIRNCRKLNISNFRIPRRASAVRCCCSTVRST